VQIVAIEPNGSEVFRFTLDGDQYTNLLGIATTIVDVKGATKRIKSAMSMSKKETEEEKQVWNPIVEDEEQDEITEEGN
jgi:hypothetical protein